MTPRFGGRSSLCSYLYPLLVIILVKVGQRYPSEAHLVNRALAVPDPVPRIRVVFIVGGVVVPRRDVNDRSGRQERRNFVLVWVRDMPSELIITDAAESLCPRRPWARRIGP